MWVRVRFVREGASKKIWGCPEAAGGRRNAEKVEVAYVLLPEPLPFNPPTYWKPGRSSSKPSLFTNVAQKPQMHRLHTSSHPSAQYQICRRPTLTQNEPNLKGASPRSNNDTATEEEPTLLWKEPNDTALERTQRHCFGENPKKWLDPQKTS